MRKAPPAIAKDNRSTRADRRYVEPNGDNDMTESTQAKPAGLLKNKPLIFLVAAFVLLIGVGIATS